MATITLIHGSEELFAKRGLDIALKKARQKSANIGTVFLEASAYNHGDVVAALSPSLLSGETAVVVENAANCTDALIDDVVELVNAAQNGQQIQGALIIQHSGAVRGKRMITALKGAQNTGAVEIIEAKALKGDGEKMAFINAEFRRLGKAVQNDAANALVLAVGGNLSELASYIQQIADDLPDEIQTVNRKVVDFYFGGASQVNTFDIVNAAIEGNLPRALKLYKTAANNGLEPIALVMALAAKMRQLGQVARMMSRNLTPQEVGLTAWQINNAKTALRRFNSALLADSFEALANANVACIGQDADAGFLATQKTLIAISGQSLP
jgi:DNA polymerase-3 subunit delta